MAWLLVAVAVVAAAGLAWALFEAQWVEYLTRDAPVQGLPPELDGLRILHISDFHLGTVSLNGRALRKAVDWAAPQELDLVAVTGDLVSRQRGVRTLRRELGRLQPRYGTYAVLGNHDVASTRDPFSRPADLSGVDAAVLLEHESVGVGHDGRRVQVAGGDPRRHREPHGPLADPDADFRILLVHFPDDVRMLAPGEFHLILAGHLHGGQICVPAPRGKVRLEHLRAPYWEGLFELPQGTLHVSRGLGTSFVPFRLLARPEATILTLRSPE
jgi:predicted MPP superfamily phosphohydrolase